MQRYMRSHLSDPSLLESAATHAGRERSATSDLLADIAEIDERRLFVRAGYPSLFAWCVGELRLCDQAAFKRIQAVRAARRFPALFTAVAEGRLHLTAVVLLAAHLTESNAEELLAAATHKTTSEIERLLAERFPKSDMLAWVAAIPVASPAPSGAQEVESGACQLSSRIVHNGTVAPPVGERSSAKPLSSESFAIQFTLSKIAYDKLRYAQELLSHQLPAGDIAEVFVRALDALIPELEKQKFAATERPRAGQRRLSAGGRHIPADVKRSVWKRDGGQCTFVSSTGHRCEARTRLEFDHITEFARGGEATVPGIRLTCRTHNRYGAECTFGPEFMRHKRLAAAEARADAKARAATAACAQTAAVDHAPADDGEDRDVVPWLRTLGLSAAEARHAAERCEEMPDASLEQRLRVALSCFGKRSTRVGSARGGLETAAVFAGAAPGRGGP